MIRSHPHSLWSCHPKHGASLKQSIYMHYSEKWVKCQSWIQSSSFAYIQSQRPQYIIWFMKVFRLLQKHPPIYSSIFILLSPGDVEIASLPTIRLALPSGCQHLTCNYIHLWGHLCPPPHHHDLLVDGNIKGLFTSGAMRFSIAPLNMCLSIELVP